MIICEGCGKRKLSRQVRIVGEYALCFSCIEQNVTPQEFKTHIGPEEVGVHGTAMIPSVRYANPDKKVGGIFHG